MSTRASGNAGEEKKVTLKSCDDVGTSRSILLKNMIEDVGETDQSIPLPNVNEKVLDRDQKGKELSLYIKGITPQMTREKLAEAFDSQEAYQKALSMKTIQIPGFTDVIVEERLKNYNRTWHRSNYDNHYQQRNFNPHNGMNAQRGGRGGDRRNTFPRPPAKSPNS
ncbi:10556_t:CDS:2 [Acaulospora morrowiae]|uniref:10556_t:CDS:1 n=1 Tax=Acaulospora morrowiae TaxID=94023 RepID=A0A9N9A387_9GLOM|nr:10556_t:CDS:2 [Acaulospora morrowiae]